MDAPDAALRPSGRKVPAGFRYTRRSEGESRVTDPPPEGQGHSVWERMRRRKVVQWSVAYAAGA
jgi:hypothetical protein